MKVKLIRIMLLIALIAIVLAGVFLYTNHLGVSLVSLDQPVTFQETTIRPTPPPLPAASLKFPVGFQENHPELCTGITIQEDVVRQTFDAGSPIIDRIPSGSKVVITHYWPDSDMVNLYYFHSPDLASGAIGWIRKISVHYECSAPIGS